MGPSGTSANVTVFSLPEKCWQPSATTLSAEDCNPRSSTSNIKGLSTCSLSYSLQISEVSSGEPLIIADEVAMGLMRWNRQVSVALNYQKFITHVYSCQYCSSSSRDDRPSTVHFGAGRTDPDGFLGTQSSLCHGRVPRPAP